MHRYVLIFMLIVVITEGQESASNPNRRKWSDRQIFVGTSANTPNSKTPTWGVDRPSWGSGRPAWHAERPSTNKPVSNRPSWGVNRPSWGVDRPSWGSGRPAWQAVKPRTEQPSTNKPVVNRPSWDFDKPSWVSGRPSWSDPGNFTNIESEERSCVPSSLPLTANSKCCGIDAISNHRIIGGNVTHIEQHPWLVQIEYHDRDIDVFRRLCGGFLISNRYVLSAAHCFSGAILKLGSPVNVILGEYDVRNEGKDCVRTERGTTDCTDGAIKVRIEKYRTNPGYLFDNVRNLNDIAIVRMSRTVEYTKFIRPICLPSADITVSPPADLRFITAGWGAIKHVITVQNGQRVAKMEYDDLKRDVDVPFLPTTRCLEQFSFLTERHICAGGEAGKDSCRGDSGGPLMHQRDGVFEAVGVVSTASGKYPCGTEHHVAVYTNVYQYRDWINDWINEQSKP